MVDRLEFPDVVEWFLGEGSADWAPVGQPVLEAELELWRSLHEEVLAGGGASATLHGYLQNMDMVPKTPVAGPTAVRCLTVHGAKGLEFKHVYLTGLAQEVLPSYQALQKGADSRAVEEERRNCFVAITRTQESLTLTRARRYFGYPKRPSQFLSEMGLEGV